MAAMQVSHMNKGDGETSYARNSLVQCKIISIAKPVIEEAVLEMLCSDDIPESLEIADLGCSSGPNTLLVVSEIMSIIRAKSGNLNRPSPELRVSLNDLPNNDFNQVFASLPGFYNRLTEEKSSGRFIPCFISGVPGSFYSRLFPKKSLHFVHSSSSLHWLSQVPPELKSNGNQAINKGKIYISKTSPPYVMDVYSLQFQKDFSLFLRLRSEEMIVGGRMVLSFMGRRSSDPTTEESCYQWELLAQALMSMAREGIIEEKKIDSFNAPYYAPCPEELKLEIMKEGSFILDRLEAFEIDWDDSYASDEEVGGRELSSGERVAKTIRAVVESMLVSQFGEDIMDDLFMRYGEIVEDHLTKTRTKYINLVISLIKKE